MSAGRHPEQPKISKLINYFFKQHNFKCHEGKDTEKSWEKVGRK